MKFSQISHFVHKNQPLVWNITICMCLREQTFQGLIEKLIERLKAEGERERQKENKSTTNLYYLLSNPFSNIPQVSTKHPQNHNNNIKCYLNSHDIDDSHP